MVSQPPPDIKVALNSVTLATKPGDNDPVFGRMKYAWYNEDLAPVDMEWYIQTGHSFTAALTSTQRDKVYFKSCQHVCIDMDTDDSRSIMANVAAIDFVWRYGSFIYTTMSHTPATPRCRVFFTLSEPMTDAQEYEDCVAGLLYQFPDADPVTRDATRLYYGSKGCSIMVLRGKMELDIDVFRALGQDTRDRQDVWLQMQASKVAHSRTVYGDKSDPTTYNGKLGPMLIDDVLRAPAGERNHTFFLKGVKARERLDPHEFSSVLDGMASAALANGLTQHEVEKTKQSILKGTAL